MFKKFCLSSEDIIKVAVKASKKRREDLTLNPDIHIKCYSYQTPN